MYTLWPTSLHFPHLLPLSNLHYAKWNKPDKDKYHVISFIYRIFKKESETESRWLLSLLLKVSSRLQDRRANSGQKDIISKDPEAEAGVYNYLGSNCYTLKQTSECQDINLV